jgi:hypothetical protein
MQTLRGLIKGLLGKNWLSTIWEEIQSLSLNETCTVKAFVYCEKIYQ